MNRMLKTLLLWIIMIALPVQATAGVMQACCASGHPAMQAQDLASHHLMPADAHGNEDNEHGGHDATHAHHAQSAHASDPADPAGQSVSTADADQPNDHDGPSTCSACAACCIGAFAPPSAHAKTPEFGAFIESAGISGSLLAGFIPAGLERPPRFFLA